MSPFKTVLMWLFYLTTFSLIYFAYSSYITGDWLLDFLRSFYGDLEYGQIFGTIYEILRTTACLALNGIIILAVHRSRRHSKETRRDQPSNEPFKRMPLPKSNSALFVWIFYFLAFLVIFESLSIAIPYQWKVWLVSSVSGEDIVELGCEYDGEFELMIVALTLNCAFIYATSFILSRWRVKTKSSSGEV